MVATAAAERGLTVSEFARGRGAVVAINGDYFDPALNPVGLAMGDGAVWAQADERVRRQEVVGVGRRRVRIFPRADPLREPKRWMTGAVSGWPMVVRGLRAGRAAAGQRSLHAARRTRAPPSACRRTGAACCSWSRTAAARACPASTLPELAALMVELGACTALNLDGGGSSALWLRDRIVNRPSDAVERKVANHLASWSRPRRTH